MWFDTSCILISSQRTLSPPPTPPGYPLSFCVTLYMYPQAGMPPVNIWNCRRRIGVGNGLAFCVAGCPAVAGVSFSQRELLGLRAPKIFRGFGRAVISFVLPLVSRGFVCSFGAPSALVLVAFMRGGLVSCVVCAWFWSTQSRFGQKVCSFRRISSCLNSVPRIPTVKSGRPAL